MNETNGCDELWVGRDMSWRIVKTAYGASLSVGWGHRFIFMFIWGGSTSLAICKIGICGPIWMQITL